MDNSELRKCINDGFHEHIQLLFRVYVQADATGDPGALERFVNACETASDLRDLAIAKFK